MAPDYQRREWLIVSALSISVLITALIPFLYGYFSTPANLVFIGSRNNNFLDFPTYISWIEQARQGHFFFIDLFTSESQLRVFAHPLFFIIGLFGKLTNLPNIFLYYATKFIIGFLYLHLGYRLTAHLIPSLNRRLFLFGLFAIGSGLGWMYGYPSVDIIQSEATNFLTLYESLINTSAITIILATILLLVNWDIKREFIKSFLLSSLLLNLLVIIHAYDIVIVSFLIFAYSLYKVFTTKELIFLRMNYVIIAAAPSVIWVISVLNNNPVFGVWSFFQTAVPAQYWLNYIATFGLLFVLAIFGFWISRRENSVIWLLALWLLIGLAFLFNPLSSRFQQKMSPGLFIPLIFLAGLALIKLMSWLLQPSGKVMKYALPISILFTFALTNLRVISDDIIIFSHHTKPLYQDRALMESLVWLKNNSSSEQKVLTDSSIGNLVPAYSGRQVYIGHYDQTVDPAEKENLIQLVFSANNESTLKNFLITQKLDYVFVDQEIRDLGFSDTNKPYLKLVFDNSDVQIYKVQ